MYLIHIYIKPRVIIKLMSTEQNETPVFDELPPSSEGENLVDFSNDTEKKRANDVNEKEVPCLEFEGQLYPLSTFNQINFREGQVYLINPQVGLAIPLDINNEQQMKAFGIEECNVQMIKIQLERMKQNQGRQVPEGYENKYCALFSGKVMYSFDTREELDAFRSGPGSNIGILFTYFYPLVTL